MTTVHTIRPAFAGILAASAIALTFCAGLATADELKFKLSGDQEVPPVSTQAQGNGEMSVDKEMAVSGKVMTSGIMGSAAHIHRGKAGANGPVIVSLSKHGDSDWMVPAGATLSPADYQAYLDGGLYVNVHSAAHPGGEIRGQLMPHEAAMGDR